MAGMRMPEKVRSMDVCVTAFPPAQKLTAITTLDVRCMAKLTTTAKTNYILHPETRKQLETCLLILRDEGEDACFAYIRKELLGKKK